jgi:predicted nuclease of predicted toxin-antitoxin system
MTYRLLLDEHIEHEVFDRLESAGHDVEHIDCMAVLGKGASDTALAAYSVTTDRTIVTIDEAQKRDGY